MLIEKRFNYAFGIILCVLVLGFLCAPYIIDAYYINDYSCYEFIRDFSAIRTIEELNETRTLLLANYSLIILIIILACILVVFALMGIILKSTKYKESKAESLISTIYSLMLLVFIIAIYLLIVLSFTWYIKSSSGIGYSLILLYIAISALLPYFSATKFYAVFIAFKMLNSIIFGLVALALHRNLLKPRYEYYMAKKSPKN